MTNPKNITLESNTSGKINANKSLPEKYIVEPNSFFEIKGFDLDKDKIHFNLRKGDHIEFFYKDKNTYISVVDTKGNDVSVIKLDVDANWNYNKLIGKTFNAAQNIIKSNPKVLENQIPEAVDNIDAKSIKIGIIENQLQTRDKALHYADSNEWAQFEKNINKRVNILESRINGLGNVKLSLNGITAADENSINPAMNMGKGKLQIS